MNRFVIAFIAAFIFTSCGDGSINGVLLKDVFAEVQSLFRPREEIMSLFHWIIIGQAGLALSFVMIYATVSPGWNRGRCSARNQLEILAVSARCAIYATQPFRQSFSCW